MTRNTITLTILLLIFSDGLFAKDTDYLTSHNKKMEALRVRYLQLQVKQVDTSIAALREKQKQAMQASDLKLANTLEATVQKLLASKKNYIAGIKSKPAPKKAVVVKKAEPKPKNAPFIGKWSYSANGTTYYRTFTADYKYFITKLLDGKEVPVTSGSYAMVREGREFVLKFGDQVHRLERGEINGTMKKVN